MNYIGSKYKLLPFIHSTVAEIAGNDLSQKVFCDMFAGTATVGRSFKGKVAKVIANDLEYYSYVLAQNYIGNTQPIAHAQELLQELNALPLGEEGFIFRNYCQGAGSQRLYFSDHNGKKIDAIRSQIETWKQQKRIDEQTFFFLVASLLESADKVANTASLYGAFLKKLKPTAQKDFQLQAAYFELSTQHNIVYQQDSNQLITRIESDILYLDPPYNQRQYGANYHLLNTIALYQPFVPQGKTGLPTYQKSNYCRKNSVADQLDELLRKAHFPYIFLSYNNEGLLPPSQIRSLMTQYGTYELRTQTYSRFKADSNRHYAAQQTQEHIHVLVKRQ
jgi:adenine-specific DNA-methyltransferase